MEAVPSRPTKRMMVISRVRYASETWDLKVVLYAEESHSRLYSGALVRGCSRPPSSKRTRLMFFYVYMQGFCCSEFTLVFSFSNSAAFLTWPRRCAAATSFALPRPHGDNFSHLACLLSFFREYVDLGEQTNCQRNDKSANLGHCHFTSIILYATPFVKKTYDHVA